MTRRTWGSWAFVLCLAYLSGCTGGPPETFRLGSSISMGDDTLTISHVEASSKEDRSQLVVFFRWDGAVGDLVAWFPRLNMTIVDEDGNKHTSKLAIPEELHQAKQTFESAMESANWNQAPSAYEMENMAYLQERMIQLEKDLDAGRNPGRWVHVFQVPREAHGFTLLVKNPDPRQGQPRLAAVPLGR